MAASAVWEPSHEHTSYFPSHRSSSSTGAQSSRPKLSLNTAFSRSLGRGGSGSLSLNTMSATSPTSSNTFRNGCDAHVYSASSTAPPSKEQGRSPLERLLQRSQSTPVDSKDDSRMIPYTISSDVQPILRNSPFTSRSSSIISSSTAPSSIAPSSSSTPLSSRSSSDTSLKKVCFRDPVDEEIKTKLCLLRFESDVDTRSRSSSPYATTTSRNATSHLPPKAKEVAPTSRKALFSAGSGGCEECEEDEDAGGDDVEIFDQSSLKHEEDNHTDADDQDSSYAPKTPVAGRHQKEREWVWTLGPVPPGIASFGSPALSETSSDEDLDDSLEETVAAASGFS